MSEIIPMPEPRPANVCRACGGEKTEEPEFCWDCSQYVRKQRAAIETARELAREQIRKKRRLAFFSKHKAMYIDA